MSVAADTITPSMQLTRVMFTSIKITIMQPVHMRNKNGHVRIAPNAYLHGLHWWYTQSCTYAVWSKNNQVRKLYVYDTNYDLDN